jgi:hypothetical protein
MPDEYRTLRDHFDDHPFLIVDNATGDVRVATVSDAAERNRQLLDDGKPCLMMGLSAALVNFRRLLKSRGGTQRTFSLFELAVISGTAYSVLNSWHDEGIIASFLTKEHGKERRCTFANAFAAGLCGALRRYGVSLENIKKAADLVREIVAEKEQVTA